MVFGAVLASVRLEMPAGITHCAEIAVGVMLIAPAGVPHGIRNDGDERLIVAAILAPGPGATSKPA